MLTRRRLTGTSLQPSLIRRTVASALCRRACSGAASSDRSLWRPTARRLRLFELTLTGRRQSLRQLGLSSTEAARHHGHLTHGSRAQLRMLRHLAHTVGANQFSSTWYSALGASPERGATTHCSNGAARRRVGVAVPAGWLRLLSTR